MADLDLLKGVAAKTVDTLRLRTHVLTGGAEGGAPILFVHGNASSSRFFEETLAALPGDGSYWGLAPDLRGYGDSETKPLDATRGVADFSDDLHALADALGLGARKRHLVGWSVGGAVALRYTQDHPHEVASITLINPLSPYGFGGTKDAAGTPCWPDHAGSGGGLTTPDFVQRLREGDRGDKDLISPRNVMNAIYYKPPFRSTPAREEVLLTALLSTKLTEGNYPGNATPSENWPHVAPGVKGINNALSPKYCNLKAFAAIDPKPPVLWIRGADDAFVSDTSLRDFGYLGQLGVVPNWPGKDIYPPQPMVSQMRAVLEAYVKNGGNYREEVIEDCGHTPQVEKPDAFRQALFGFIEEYS
ncbi:MAG: alpha/beta hydrolase [Gammaproteobacteria bacterium]|nr:alpha/beta hydrolase [Gammaproteobacteria bacterium]